MHCNTSLYYCTALHYTELQCTVLHSIAWHQHCTAIDCSMWGNLLPTYSFQTAAQIVSTKVLIKNCHNLPKETQMQYNLYLNSPD